MAAKLKTEFGWCPLCGTQGIVKGSGQPLCNSCTSIQNFLTEINTHQGNYGIELENEQGHLEAALKEYHFLTYPTTSTPKLFLRLDAPLGLVKGVRSVYVGEMKLRVTSKSYNAVEFVSTGPPEDVHFYGSEVEFVVPGHMNIHYEPGTVSTVAPVDIVNVPPQEKLEGEEIDLSLELGTDPPTEESVALKLPKLNADDFTKNFELKMEQAIESAGRVKEATEQAINLQAMAQEQRLKDILAQVVNTGPEALKFHYTFEAGTGKQRFVVESTYEIPQSSVPVKIPHYLVPKSIPMKTLNEVRMENEIDPSIQNPSNQWTSQFHLAANNSIPALTSMQAANCYTQLHTPLDDERNYKTLFGVQKARGNVALSEPPPPPAEESLTILSEILSKAIKHSKYLNPMDWKKALAGA